MWMLRVNECCKPPAVILDAAGQFCPEALVLHDYSDHEGSTGLRDCCSSTAGIHRPRTRYNCDLCLLINFVVLCIIYSAIHTYSAYVYIFALGEVPAAVHKQLSTSSLVAALKHYSERISAGC